MSAADSENKGLARTVVKVIGVGSAGIATVNSMIKLSIYDVEYHTVGIDAQGLELSNLPNVLQATEIEKALAGADLVFIVTDSGDNSAPAVAECAKSRDALVIGAVIGTTADGAALSIEGLRKQADTVFVLEDKHLSKINQCDECALGEAELAAKILCQFVQGISDLLGGKGLIDIALADLQTVMAGANKSVSIGMGKAGGENRAMKAMELAMESMLLLPTGLKLDGAKNILVNFCVDPAQSLLEINAAVSLLDDTVETDVNIIFGVIVDEKMVEEMRIVLYQFD